MKNDKTTLSCHHSAMNYVDANVGAAVPSEFRKIAQWITWKAGPIKSDGKFEKIPYGKDGTGRAWQQAQQWTTFDLALQSARSRGHSGIGFVLPAKTASGEHIIALDFDTVDLSDGEDDPRRAEIRKIHQRLGEPYIEISPSGKGIRMFVRSVVSIDQVSTANPLGGKDELFCASGKWVTVTGVTLGGTSLPDATQAIQALAAQWRNRYSGDKTVAKSTREVLDLGVLSHLGNVGWQGWPPHKIRDGDGREETMLSYAGHLRSQGISQAEIEQRCLEANNVHYADPLDMQVVLDRARRYAQAAIEKSTLGNCNAVQFDDVLLGQVDRTDAGNTALLFNLTSGEMRYVYEHKTWIVWNSDRWNFDRPSALVHTKLLLVASFYQNKADKLIEQAKDSSMDDLERKKIHDAAKAISKWAAQCRNKKFLDAMLSLAQRDPRFLIQAKELDANLWLLGVENGVIDLRTGLLQPDSKESFVLKRCPVIFNPSAKAPRWHGFIFEITSCPDGLENGKIKPLQRANLAAYLQKALGYCITGRVSEHVMFIAIGDGSNGKNVLLDTIKAIGGDYIETIAPEVLMATKLDHGAEQASPSIRKLAGARCAISSESKEGQRLDIAVVKRHTGGGSMTARSLHENPVTFEITHKLWLSTNHKPQIDHIDSATKGRLHMIPFLMQWNRPSDPNPNPVLHNADKGLMDVLRQEFEGILLWLIAGAVRYHKEGLSPPAEVAVFTQDYIQSQDVFTRWLGECEVCPIEEGHTAGDLQINYREFCRVEEESYQIDTAASLGRRLKAQGYQFKKTRDGTRYNLRPKNTPEASVSKEGVKEFPKALEGLFMKPRSFVTV